jgi:dienelactone hydrolase
MNFGTIRRRKVITYIVIAAVLVVYFGLSAYGARETMLIPRLPLEESPESTGLIYEDIEFQSCGDNTILKGWYMPGNRDNVILMVNGGFQNRLDDNVDTLGLTGALVQKGYSVLLFDQRGRGESGGKGLALSNIDQDIGGAIDFLKEKGHPVEKICIMGFCSGAVSSCIFASRNSVGSLILDGCFISIPVMVVKQGASVGPPEFLVWIFIPGVFLMTKILYGYDMVNSIDVIDDIKCPVLFIHEEKDEFITKKENGKTF